MSQIFHLLIVNKFSVIMHNYCSKALGITFPLARGTKSSQMKPYFTVPLESNCTLMLFGMHLSGTNSIVRKLVHLLCITKENTKYLLWGTTSNCKIEIRGLSVSVSLHENFFSNMLQLYHNTQCMCVIRGKYCLHDQVCHNIVLSALP